MASAFEVKTSINEIKIQSKMAGSRSASSKNISRNKQDIKNR